MLRPQSWSSCRGVRGTVAATKEKRTNKARKKQLPVSAALQMKTNSRKSSSSRLMKRWFSTGKLSAPNVQTMAEAECGEGVKNTFVRKLSKAGNTGKNKNTSQDIMRQCLKHSTAPMPYGTDVTMWDLDQNCKIKQEMYFMVGYETMDNKIGPTGDISKYTGISKDNPYYNVRQEWLHRKNFTGDPNSVIGVGIWGDAAKFYNRDSVYLILFNCISGLDQDSKF